MLRGMVKTIMTLAHLTKTIVMKTTMIGGSIIFERNDNDNDDLMNPLHGSTRGDDDDGEDDNNDDDETQKSDIIEYLEEDNDEAVSYTHLRAHET